METNPEATSSEPALRTVHEICTAAIEVLRATNDGDDLDSRDLKLTECAVNGFLNPEGVRCFADLLARVRAGYERPWLHGIENLTQDIEGYVFWRRIQVEHYSFRDFERERTAAHDLGDVCRALETANIVVTGRSVLDYCIQRRVNATKKAS